jgi:hypothetical protein
LRRDAGCKLTSQSRASTKITSRQFAFRFHRSSPLLRRISSSVLPLEGTKSSSVQDGVEDKKSLDSRGGAGSSGDPSEVPHPRWCWSPAAGASECDGLHFHLGQYKWQKRRPKRWCGALADGLWVCICVTVCFADRHKAGLCLVRLAVEPCTDGQVCSK